MRERRRAEKLEILNLKYALELVGDEEELLNDLLQSFLDEKKLDEEKLEKLIKENHEEAAFYVHYIKGASRQVAAERLAEAGQNLEDVLRKRKDGNLEELKKNFTCEYKIAREAIENAVAEK